MPVRSRRLFLTALFAVSLLSGCALKKAAEGSQTASQKTAKPLQRKPSVNSAKTIERPKPQKAAAAAKERSFVPVFLPARRSSPSTSRLSFASAPKPPSMALRLRFRPFVRQSSLLRAASMRFSPRSA